MSLFQETHMNEEALTLFLLWGQTDEDRAGIAEFFADERAVAAGIERARVIAETDTRDIRTPSNVIPFRRAA